MSSASRAPVLDDHPRTWARWSTGTGQFVGTLDYAAPEQFEGTPLTPRTDIYSLACLLYECLAGHPPFRRQTDAAVMYAHLMEPPPKLSEERPDVPRSVDDVFATAMAKKPDERYPSAGAAVTDFATALGVTQEAPWIAHHTA
jgi:serine/threonine-protein kinase